MVVSNPAHSCDGNSATAIGLTGFKGLPVSVVIPCYNCADTIARALESIATQTLAPSEVIIVDDASSDGGRTLAAINEIAGKYSHRFRIEFLRLAHNKGPASARNAGLDACTQRYIAFLDADDAWHPWKLECQYKWMLANGAQICGHDTVILDNVSEFPVLPDSWKAQRISKVHLLASNRMPMRSVMISKTLGLRFEEGLYHAEDYAAWLLLAWTGHQLWRIPLPLVCSFKPEFGGGGLSGNLWSMQRGELRAFRTLYRAGLIPQWLWVASVLLSWLKYFWRRLLS